jgi:hypothetical protein
MNLFELFDGYWQENFSSAVLALAFQASPHFRRRLLGLILREAPAKRRSAARRPPDSYVVSREVGFTVGRGGVRRRGRFDLLLTSGSCAVAIENKIEAPLTVEQIKAQRKALEEKYTSVLACSLTKYREPGRGADASLRWSQVEPLLPRRSAAEFGRIGEQLITGMAHYFGGFDMEFKGFKKTQRVYETHRQRQLLLEALLDNLKRGDVSNWHDTRNTDSDYYYQSACFRDLRGIRGRYLGFYDYKDGDRTKLELYAKDGGEPLHLLEWHEVQKMFPAGHADLEGAVTRLAKRYDAKLKKLPMARRRRP